MEITVDAYTEYERVTGWHCYLEALEFAFTARCISENPLSPLLVGDEVGVSQMVPTEDCEYGGDGRGRVTGGRLYPAVRTT